MLGNRSKLRIKNLPAGWFQSYTSLQAEFGLKRIREINSEDKLRIDNANKIKKELKYFVDFPKVSKKSKHTYWQLLAYSEQPKKTIKNLLKNGVDTCSTSLEKLSSLKNYSYNIYLKNVNKVYDKALFIPCNHELNKNDGGIIINQIKKLKSF